MRFAGEHTLCVQTIFQLLLKCCLGRGSGLDFLDFVSVPSLVADFVAGSYQYCPILCLWIGAFIFLDVLWW